jgi:YegS/Rv2252/BmrU family lipid kinase
MTEGTGPGPDRGRPVEPGAAIEHRATEAVLIADPHAGRGRVGRELPVVEEELRRRGFTIRTALSSRPGETTALARLALSEGERFLLAVGDDGTVNDVLNGMFENDRPVEPEAVLGVVAANSGSDIVRTFGLSQDPVVAAERLGVGRVYEVDVGKATAVDGGSPRTRYFLNMAQVGLGGLVASRAARLPSALRRSRTFWGYWLAMATYRRTTVRMRGDRRDFEGVVSNILVANLQFAGRGMLVSPRSWPEDGYLDLQVWTGPKSDSFTLLPRMFIGEHLPNPRILEYRSTRVEVEADRPLRVETDGRPAGVTPVTFEVLPRALRLKV